MLRAEPAEFLFYFYPLLVTFWGTLVTNDAKIVYFTFTYIFWGHLGHNVFGGHEGVTRRYAPVRSRAGPKIE